MQSISLDNQIQKYLPLLEQDEKQSILGVIKSFIKNKEKTLFQEFSIEDYNKELNDAETSMNAGNFISQDEAEKLADTWF
jgi:hypothetical protein